MRTVTVKKVVGVCFHDAVKLAIDHLGVFRLAQEDAGQPVSPQLLHCYAACRRLRDYLQCALRAARDDVRLELPAEEWATLVACCRRYVDSLDQQVQAARPGKERQLLVRKSEVIGDWTVVLATAPLLELPIPQLENRAGEASSRLARRLHEKLVSKGPEKEVHEGKAQGVGGMALGPQLDHRIDDLEQDEHPATYDIFGQSFTPLAKAPEEDEVADEPDEPLAAEPDEPDEPDELDEPDEEETTAAPLLDASVLRDPRLRSMVSMNLRSLGTAGQTGDHRLTTMLLAAVLDAAVLDYALPRRKQLGLAGGAESWNPQQILRQILADQLDPADDDLIGRLFLARDILKPGIQMRLPSVANAVTVQRSREFVATALFMLGYRNTPGRARSRLLC